MYKIGDFASAVNIPVKTLRYYDEIDLLKPSYQDCYTGYRYYEKEQLYKIEKIKKLKELDLSLKEIKEYLETNNMDILANKEREFIMKIEAVKNYVQQTTYQIKKSNYEDYIKWNGLKEADNPIALELRDNVCKYYVIFKNKEYYSEVIIFEKAGNLINLNITFGIQDYLGSLLECLRNDYDYLIFKSNEELYNNLDIIREHCNCIEELVEEFEGYDGKKIKLTSIKVDLKAM